jgi:O-succinylbenzoic acid--CoA ligase
MTRSVPDPLLERVRQSPSAPALRARSATWDRAQLLEAADGLAAALAADGLGEGSRVAVLLDDDAPAVAAVHALRRLGAVHVPLNRRAARTELAGQLRAAGADALLVDGAGHELGAAAAGTALPVHRVEALLAGAPCGPGPALRSAVDPGAVATIVFTSGTSGEPRAALLTHDNQRASAHAWAGLLRARPGQRWLVVLPLFHVAGLAIVTRATRWGASLEVHDRFDPGAVTAALDGGITHVSLVATQLEALLAERLDRPAPATLQAVLLGGGPLPQGLVERARAAAYPLLTTYGLTETGSGVASGGADEQTLAHPGTLRALPGVELRIEPDGTPDGSGEILVRGSMVFAGYLGDEAATAARLRDGWLHTGDVGSLDGDGLLRVLDRRDDLLVSGGENVIPAEVEAVLGSCPGVLDAAVYGVPDPRWGSVPEASVVVAEGGPTDDELQRHCRARLAAYKVPRRFERLGELPRNAGGKVLRRQLQQRATRR